jgi:hypothetical protein
MEDVHLMSISCGSSCLSSEEPAEDWRYQTHCVQKKNSTGGCKWSGWSQTSVKHSKEMLSLECCML